jgi:hypothetical protein
MPAAFIAREPQLEDFWRGIILFGRNVASYKFALAKSLLEIQPRSGELLRLEDLAPVYARHIVTHLKQVDRQGTFENSHFLSACRAFIQGDLDDEQLRNAAMRYGFRHVIAAFHTIDNTGKIVKPFFLDETRTGKGIRITNEFAELLERDQAKNLPQEVEARWRLVETA